jgi:hypothetical protein
MIRSVTNNSNYSAKGDSGKVSAVKDGFAVGQLWGGDNYGNSFLTPMEDVLKIIREETGLDLEV